MNLPQYAFGSRQLKRQKPLIRGTDVRQLQQALKHMGFFRARVDGIFGYKTYEAVREFQRYFNLRQSGIVANDEINLLKEFVQMGINKWLTPWRDFAYSSYLPVSISAEPRLVRTWNISDIIALNSTSDRLIVTTKNQIFAISLISGDVLWKTARLFPEAPPVISEGQLLVPAQNLEILDLYSGKSLYSLDEDVFTTPVAVSNSKIYAPSGGAVYAFDRKGHVLWRYRTDGAFCTSPTLGYDLIFFASYDRNIYCLDDKGVLYWKTKISDIVKVPLALWDGKIFAVLQDAWICAINPLLGEILWQKKLPDEECMMPAFHPDFMVLVNYEGQVTALSFQSANIKWVIELPAAPTTSPIALKETLFIGTEEGLMAYDLKTLEYKQYLTGEKITALMPTALSLFVATDKRLAKLMPK
ncbi:MAG TPA: PQQ-binding-like beta-propeller repeat protein [Thermoanaerobacterales bacterium]|nr:PQQ-binding-like beta-propeller repeat protein [Thermoanaerobacterales bacterium]